MAAGSTSSSSTPRTSSIADGELMRGLEIRFQDADHFEQLWTSRAKGKDRSDTFAYVRKK